MEEKQLNINRPLLSVRRFSSIAASNERRKNNSCLPNLPPVEFKADPTRNTGSIPFVWEHSPGRPKDEAYKQIKTKEIPPSIPKLPPGRILKPKKIPEDINLIKGPTMDLFSLHSVLPIEENVTKKESSDSNDDDDEAYMDALDTLSRDESFFYNCSASGVSGLGSDRKPSGVFSADPKVREFMMGRFLPAAKAMASEVPQHAPRTQVVEEKPREVKKLANVDNKNLQLRYGPNFLQDDDHDSEEDDNDHDYNEHGNISSKLCGLLPRFCLKGSFGLVNPVPGLSMRTRLPMYAANRTHASSSSISSISETENELARVAVYEHRSLGRSYLANQEEKSFSKSGISTTPSESPRSYVSEINDLSSRKKGLTSSKEMDGQDLVIEKTLYVDTVHSVKSPKARKGQTNSCESIDSDTLDDESKHDIKTEMCKDSWEDPEVDTEMVDNTKGNQDLKSCRNELLELPVPPPLPKSPSDSWLWRTLPSKNAPIWRNPKNPSSNSFSNDPKPEENPRFGYSQGPLLPIPEISSVHVL